MNSQVRKLVVVGDGAVGKTCLLIVLVRGEFPSEYIPTVFDNYVVDMEVKGERIDLILWDTAAQGDFHGDRMRSLGYPRAHAFLICFSVSSPDSLDNVREKWDPEIKHFGAGKVPRFLVGCKTDLRRDPGTLWRLAQYQQTPVTTNQGEEVAKAIGAKYFECSSKTGEGVRELFVRVTEIMEAGRVVPLRNYYHKPWYRGGGCIVV